MKNHFNFLLVFFFTTAAYGQSQQYFVFDTISTQQQLSKSRYYSKTNFSFIDTLSLWNYQLDTTYNGNKDDSVRPIGQLIFWRTKPIDDGISQRLYNQLWTPYIAFDIFNIGDFAYCNAISNKTRYLSSCVPPEVGGDLMIFDKFVFLNRNVCLECQRHDTKVDYCRPVINYIFSKLDRTKMITIHSLVNQFVIVKGQLPKK